MSDAVCALPPLTPPRRPFGSRKLPAATTKAQRNAAARWNARSRAADLCELRATVASLHGRMPASPPLASLDVLNHLPQPAPPAPWDDPVLAPRYDAPTPQPRSPPMTLPASRAGGGWGGLQLGWPWNPSALAPVAWDESFEGKYDRLLMTLKLPGVEV